MKWCRQALACLLASLLVLGIASASTVTSAETRVWAFDRADEVERSPTPGLPRGCEPTYDDLASDSLLAAREQVRGIGRQISEEGGIEKMKLLCYRVRHLGGDDRWLEMVWTGIGEWMG